MFTDKHDREHHVEVASGAEIEQKLESVERFLDAERQVDLQKRVLFLSEELVPFLSFLHKNKANQAQLAPIIHQFSEHIVRLLQLLPNDGLLRSLETIFHEQQTAQESVTVVQSVRERRLRILSGASARGETISVRNADSLAVINAILQVVDLKLPSSANQGVETAYQVDSVQTLRQHVIAQEILLQAAQYADEDLRRLVVQEHAYAAKERRIAGTPVDKKRIEEIQRELRTPASKTGSILYLDGPGTGKTEILIHAIKEAGYKPFVISMERYISSEMLLGEAPITTAASGEALRNSRVQTLEHQKNQLLSLIDKRTIALVELSHQQEGIRLFLAEYLRSEGLALENFDSDAELITVLENKKNGLREWTEIYYTQQILALSFSAETGEQAWKAAGIALAAMRGEIPIIDEIEKAENPEALLYPSSMSPGSELTLPNGVVIRFPPWFRIFGAANTLMITEALNSRFNVRPLPLAEGNDLIEKTLGWVEGMRPVDAPALSAEEEAKIIAFFLHIVPKINAEADGGRLRNRFDQRRMQNFLRECVSPSGGFDQAMLRFVLTEGEISDIERPEQMQWLQNLLKEFSEIGRVGQFQLRKDDAVQQSPLYEYVSHAPLIEGEIKVARDAQPIAIQQDVRDVLIQEAVRRENKTISDEGDQLDLACGISILLESGDSTVIKVYDVSSNTLLRTKRIHENNLKIVDSDATGHFIMVESGSDLLALDLFAPNVEHLILEKEKMPTFKEARLSSNGQFLVTEHTNEKGQWLEVQPLHPNQQFPVRLVLNGSKDNYPIHHWSFDANGRVLLLQLQNGDVHIVDVDKEIARQGYGAQRDEKLVLQKPFDQAQNAEGQWDLVDGVLFHSDSLRAYRLYQ